VMDKPGKRRIRVEMESPSEEQEVLVLVMGIEKGIYELDLAVRHKTGSNTGKVEIRGIAKNGAQIKSCGMIRIEEGAQRVEDFLEMRFLILDEISQAEAVPQLEIMANDVKASHAASVGRLDDEQLFYLMSRGLSRDRSEEVLVEGFLAGVRERMIK